MGRLTEYFGKGSHHGGSGSTQQSGGVEVVGFDDNIKAFGRILTTDPDMAGVTRKYIRKLLKEARGNLSRDAKAYIKDDPRKAYRAVKSSVYKQLFGGNLSILQKRKASGKYDLVRQRKVDMNPTMRGGNRRPRIKERNRLDYYMGADRGFALRFLNGGTVPRQTRFGNRGAIPASRWFEHVAPWHMKAAADNLAEAINEYVKQQTNNG